MALGVPPCEQEQPDPGAVSVDLRDDRSSPDRRVDRSWTPRPPILRELCGSCPTATYAPPDQSDV